MLAVFAYVEFEKDPLHILLRLFLSFPVPFFPRIWTVPFQCWASHLMVIIPSIVITSEPARCENMMTNVQAYCPRKSSVTVSAEKVEKVVNPPRKPVMANSLASVGRKLL